MTTEATCKGNPVIADHPMIELGTCGHQVTGSIHTYKEFGCPDCGATARQGPLSFACGRGIKAVQPTVENCRAKKWKADHLAASRAG